LYKDRSKFELYLELLTQVKQGNCDEATLMSCANFKHREFDELVDTLLSEKLLTYERTYVGQDRRYVYHLTERGEQFIDLLVLSLNYVEVENNAVKTENRSRNKARTRGSS
jgi:predicted transcriptional regulator